MMVPEFKSSFIPKGSATESTFKESNSSVLGMLVMALFILTLISTGLLFAYKIYLQNSIKSLSLEVSQAESTIDKETILNMSKFSDKIAATKEIIIKHQAVSNLLTLVSSSTVNTIQFTAFSYTFNPDGTLILNLLGKSRDYASLALEESIINNIKEIKSAKFSDLVTGSKGEVNFDLSIVVEPNSLLYNPTTGNGSTNTIESRDPINADSLNIEDNLSDIDISLPDINDL